MSNLLDKASIILTPTAYNNGEALCVKPSDGGGDFDFSRNSAATRVNAQGLVENVQILSSNLVQNGDFSEEGSEEVSNGSFSQEGAELVTNGDFEDGSTGWGLGTGWSITNGKLTANNPTGYTFQGGVFASGTSKTYKINLTVSDYVSGYFTILTSGGTAQSQQFSANGDYTIYFDTNSPSGATFYFSYLGSFIGSIDNVSVREVGQDWDFVGEAELTEQGARIYSSSGGQSYITQNALTNTKSYKLSYEITDSTQGSLKLINVNGISGYPITSSVGTHTEYFTANNDILFIVRDSGATDVTITNISVKEVGQNWVFENSGGSFGWQIYDGKAICDGNALTPNRNLVSSTSLTSGKKYKLNLDILQSADNITIYVGGGALSELLPTGTNLNYTLYFTAPSSGALTFFASTDDLQEIDNISVIEITDDTNLPRINYEGFSYDGSGAIIPDSGCGSWLFEPASRNLIPYSELFSDASWTKIASSITSDAVISPDGTLNADKLVEDNTNGNHFIFRSQSTFTPNVSYTQSWFVKAGEIYKVRIQDAADGTFFGAYNLITGDLIDEGANSIGGTTITELSNGWYRLTLVSNQATNSRYAAIILLPNSYTSGDDIGYQGDGTSGVYIWGAQLEQQSYATSYIPNFGEANGVSRNQDVCTNGGSLASINSTEGTLYFEFKPNSADISVVSISDGSTSNFIQIYIPFSASSLRYRATTSGVVQFDNQINTAINLTLNHKYAIKWKLNDFSLWVDGIKINSQLIGSTPIGLNQINFYNVFGGGSKVNGKTKALAVFPYLSDAELTELTTI